jgi:hypothetical protein
MTRIATHGLWAALSRAWLEIGQEAPTDPRLASADALVAPMPPALPPAGGVWLR